MTLTQHRLKKESSKITGSQKKQAWLLSSQAQNKPSIAFILNSLLCSYVGI